MLEIKGLQIGYKSKSLAANIDLSVQRGEMICLLGQNGVGKSTLLRTLVGLQNPLSGDVRIDDVDVCNVQKRILARKLGYISTQRAGVANMRVSELVSLGRYPYTNLMGVHKAEDLAMIEEAISTCRINYISESKLGEISDGQYQKAILAKSMAQDTDFIIMDEPTAHLDVVNRLEIFELLKKIKKEKNKGLVISTHELGLALRSADKIWLMDYNQPIVVGTPKELLSTGAIEKIFSHGDVHLDVEYLMKSLG